MPRYDALHAYLYCDNVEKTAAFYRGLGFEQVQHFPEMNVYAFRLGASNYVMGPRPGDDDPAALGMGRDLSGPGVVLMPATREIDAVHDAALRLGARVLQPPAVQPWGSRTVVVEDPDGRRLMFEHEPDT